MARSSAALPLPLALVATAVLSAAVAGCLGEAARTRGDLPGERRAALARLVVDNRTTGPLAIAFLYAADAGGPGGEVGIGTAAAGARTELAPVPAEEPIILIARGPGFERRLDPFTLEIDELWTWVIGKDGP